MQETDEELAVAVQRGNTEVYGELVLRYEAKLKRYARRFLARAEDVEDLVQDVFIKAYIHIQSFDTSLRFSPWIYRIAHNTFVNELKRKERYGLGNITADTILPFLASAETADNTVLEKEQRDIIENSLAKLPPKYREVIALHYFEDMSYQEISDVLKIPITTVGVRLLRARDKLQMLLKEVKQ